MLAAQIHAGVEPGLGQNGRYRGRLVKIVARGKRTGRGQCAQFLRVPLLHQAKAAELPFFTIEEAMMISAPSHEEIAADAIESLYSFHHVYREWQFRDPWLADGFVSKV